MKISIISGALIVLMLASCKKDHSQGGGGNSTPPIPDATPRTVRFQLYTDQNFGDDEHNIFFKVFIEKDNGQTLWDSAYAPVKVKDVPDFANRIVTEKTLSGYANSVLKVGFRFEIEGVGNSWYIDTSSAGQAFKLVDFNLR